MWRPSAIVQGFIPKFEVMQVGGGKPKILRAFYFFNNDISQGIKKATRGNLRITVAEDVGSDISLREIQAVGRIPAPSLTAGCFCSLCAQGTWGLGQPWKCWHALQPNSDTVLGFWKDLIRKSGVFTILESGDECISQDYIGQCWGRFLRASKNRFHSSLIPEHCWVDLGCIGGMCPGVTEPSSREIS